MRYGAGLKLVPAALLAIAIAGTAMAQSASQSMREAGESTENAVSHAWHGTKTEVKDTDITAKVKTALHEDKLTKGADIHITTVAGVVTLRGTVPSEQTAARAASVTRETTGVKGVKNRLRTE
jgi:hyperosmotically inducible periplasmic protein